MDPISSYFKARKRNQSPWLSVVLGLQGKIFKMNWTVIYMIIVGLWTFKKLNNSNLLGFFCKQYYCDLCHCHYHYHHYHTFCCYHYHHCRRCCYQNDCCLHRHHYPYLSTSVTISRSLVSIIITLRSSECNHAIHLPCCIEHSFNLQLFYLLVGCYPNLFFYNSRHLVERPI